MTEFAKTLVITEASAAAAARVLEEPTELPQPLNIQEAGKRQTAGLRDSHDNPCNHTNTQTHCHTHPERVPECCELSRLNTKHPSKGAELEKDALKQSVRGGKGDKKKKENKRDWDTRIKGRGPLKAPT